jgi:MFS family permease
MGSSGAAAVVGTILLPALSDRIGRRPVLVLGLLIAALAPGIPLLVHTYSLVLTGSVFAGSLAVGVIPLFMGTVPLESLAGRASSAASGLIMGVGQVVGGFFGPVIGGILADRFSLAVPLMFAGSAVLVGMAVSLAVRETLRRHDGGRQLEAAGG